MPLALQKQFAFLANSVAKQSLSEAKTQEEAEELLNEKSFDYLFQDEPIDEDDELLPEE